MTARERMINEITAFGGLDIEKFKTLWDVIDEQGHTNHSINTVRAAMVYDNLLVARRRCIEQKIASEPNSLTAKLLRDRITILDKMLILDFTKSDRDIMLKLIDCTPLTPLTLNDDEWEPSAICKGTDINKRCYRVHRDNNTNGRPYVSDAIVIRQKNDDGTTSLCTGLIYVVDRGEYIKSTAYMTDEKYIDRVYIDTFSTPDYCTCTTSAYLKEHVGKKYELMYHKRKAGGKTR